MAAAHPAGPGVHLATLLSRVALSDQKAFAELYAKTNAHLYGVALRILGKTDAAEEILQEAYVSIWQYARSFEAAKSQPLTWLTSIVRNRCLDQLRQREIAAEAPGVDTGGAGSNLPSIAVPTTEIALESADAVRIRDCVAALEAGPRQAIVLAFRQGMNHAELAGRLHVPISTVKSWVRHGLERLRICADRGGDSPTA